MGTCFVLRWTCLLDTLHKASSSSPATRNLIFARLQGEPAKRAKIFTVFTHSHPFAHLTIIFVLGWCRVSATY